MGHAHDDWFNGSHRRSYCRSVDASATASGFLSPSGPVRMDIILMMLWRLVDGFHSRSCEQCTQYSSASCQVIMTGQWIAWIHRRYTVLSRSKGSSMNIRFEQGLYNTMTQQHLRLRYCCSLLFCDKLISSLCRVSQELSEKSRKYIIDKSYLNKPARWGCS